MGDKKKAPDPITQVPETAPKEAQPPAGAPTTGAADAGKSASPIGDAKPIDLTLTPPSLLGKEALGPDGSGGGMPSLSIAKRATPLLAGKLDPIDWASMRQPFLTHDLPLTGRDVDQISLNFYNSVGMLKGWGVPEPTALKLANLGLAFAYDTQLGLESPNTLEKFDRDTERSLGPGKKLGKFVVPVITPDTLSWAVEKVSGKKLDFHF